MDYINEMSKLALEFFGASKDNKYYAINVANKPGAMGTLEDVMKGAVLPLGKSSSKTKTLYMLKGGENVLNRKVSIKKARGSKPNMTKDEIVGEYTIKEILAKLGYRVKFVGSYDEDDID